MRGSRTVAQAAMVAGIVASGCGGGELTGPPEIRVGRDECAGCGMLLAEDRSSCALLVEEHGHRQHLVFDDPGCLLDYRAENSAVQVVEAYVHDFGTGAWVTAGSASFLFGDSEKLVTPMGSGIAAFANAAAAESRRQAAGGKIMDYQELRSARMAWKEARYGGGRTAPGAGEAQR